MADVLLPCPFCRSVDVSLYGGDVGGRYVAALCHGCSAMGPEASTHAEAITRWNERYGGDNQSTDQ